jgi:hypothetical protein
LAIALRDSQKTGSQGALRPPDYEPFEHSRTPAAAQGDTLASRSARIAKTSEKPGKIEGFFLESGARGR